MRTANWILAATVAGTIGALSPAYGQDGPPKWSVGVLGLANKTPFEAEKNSVKPIPYVAYRGDRFYIQGLELGYKLLKPSEDDEFGLGFDIIASARMLPGESRNKVTADIGVRASLTGPYGFLNTTFLHDATDTSNGMELSASYGYEFRSGKFSITPSVGISWQNRKMANYMWGVTQTQQDKMIEKNNPVLSVFEVTSSALNYNAGLTAIYNLNDNWTLIGFINGSYLDKEIRANPGIDQKYDATAGFGIAYNF